MTAREIIKVASKLSDETLDSYERHGAEAFTYNECEEMINLAVEKTNKMWDCDKAVMRELQNKLTTLEQAQNK